jgi:DNA primase
VDDKAKYLNTRQNALFDKGRTLFGIDQARQSIVDRGRAVVVEGYTDCMACHQAGVTEVVASLGTALTETHVDLIRRYAGEMVLVFDSDRAGTEAADRALRVALPRGVTVRLARVPEGKDPGEFLNGPGSGTRFIELLKDAVEALEFTWRQTWAQFQAPSSDARRQEAVLDFVRMVCDAAQTKALDAIRKGLLINQLAHLLRLDRAEVARLMASLPAGRPGRNSDIGGSPERSSGSPGGEQGAWVRLLEVVLNEPGLLGTVSVWPDAARISDPRDGRIAGWVLECAKKFGEFTLADILACARDGDDAARIAELATRGRSRGNHEASFRMAIERLEQCGALERLDAARRRLLEEPGSGPLEIYADGVRRHRHFGPMRMIRRAGGPRLDTNTAKSPTPINDTNPESL